MWPSYSCEESARLLSDDYERELRPHERFGLRIHLILCRPCSRVADQFAVLEQAARSYEEKLAAGNLGIPVRLPDKRRQQILAALTEA